MIEDSGSQGCLKSSFKNVDKKLTIQKITQILKKMQKDGLIKSLKSQNRRNQEVWMLADIEPGADVTGGLTGSEGFDLTLIKLLCDRVEAHTRRQGTASHLELIVFIKQLGIMAD